MPLDKSLIPEPLRDAIRTCLRGESGWPLFVWGKPGIGKTSAARLALQHFKAAGKPTWEKRFSLFVQDCLDVKWRRMEDGSGAVVSFRGYERAVKDAAIAVLDDLDILADVLVRAKPAALDAFYWWLEARRGKPAVLISNGGPESVARLYGPAVASRCGAGTVIEVRGPDRRIGAGAKVRVEGMEDF